MGTNRLRDTGGGGDRGRYEEGLMAATDPARGIKRTRQEWRRSFQDVCRSEPCRGVRDLLAGKTKKLPGCILCVHEAAVMRALDL